MPEFSPAVADCRYRAPLTPRLARLEANLAERVGFEPTRQAQPLPTRSPGGRLRPLSHLSVFVSRDIIEDALLVLQVPDVSSNRSHPSGVALPGSADFPGDTMNKFYFPGFRNITKKKTKKE